MRYVSDQEIKDYIKENFNIEGDETITIHTIVFEDGIMGSNIFIDDEMLEFDNDVIETENNIIELQKDIKELGSFIYKEYGIIAEVSLDLFDGKSPEYVY